MDKKTEIVYKIKIEDIFNLPMGVLYTVSFNFDFMPRPGLLIKIAGFGYKITRVATMAWPNDIMKKKHDRNCWDIMIKPLELEKNLKKGEEYLLEIPPTVIFSN